MAKSMRSKREKRLRSIRREILSADPITLKKEAAKLAAQEAALAAPKLPVRSKSTESMHMDMAVVSGTSISNSKDNNMDVEMTDKDKNMKLKPIGKKMKKKLKLAKKKGHGKGKIRKRNV